MPRFILARLDGKEIQQVAQELRVSVPTVTKWCRLFSLRGLRGPPDDPQSGKPATYSIDYPLAASAAICPAKEVTNVFRLVISERLAYSPEVTAVRGEAITAAVV